MKIRSWFNQNRFTSIVRFSCAGALISTGVVSAILALPLSTTGSNPPPAEPQVLDDSQMQAMSTTVGGAAFMGDLNPFPGFRQPATNCP